jgi:uncharacterized membrane protein YraQ (UPF0718 family)
MASGLGVITPFCSGSAVPACISFVAAGVQLGEPVRGPDRGADRNTVVLQRCRENPLVEALHDEGLPMGTLLAFMMAVVAHSLPELILLRRVLKVPLIITFVAVTGTGIVAVGYLFNAILA